MSKQAMEADWIDRVVQDVAELSDRDSPEDWPEAMLVTADELRSIIEHRAPTTKVSKCGHECDFICQIPDGFGGCAKGKGEQ